MHMGQIAAGVRTHTLDHSGTFLNIPKKGSGDVNVTARKDHDILRSSSFIGGAGSQGQMSYIP